MTDERPGTTAPSNAETLTWERLFARVKTPYKPKYPEGPWNGRHLPPMVHRSETFFFEPLGPRIRDVDYAAYMSSIAHINRALEWGFPSPGLDLDFADVDMCGCWARFGRGESFEFAALTPSRDREIGCAYLRPPEDFDDPYEAGLHIWVVEDALRDDLDIRLLTELLAWIEAEWDFKRVIYYTPESYKRGLDVAGTVGLRRVSRKQPRPSYGCFEWARPTPRR